MKTKFKLSGRRVLSALLCLLMHTLFSLLHKKAPFD